MAPQGDIMDYSYSYDSDTDSDYESPRSGQLTPGSDDADDGLTLVESPMTPSHSIQSIKQEAEDVDLLSRTVVSSSSPSLEVHSLRERDGFVVSVVPPTQPFESSERTPVDIVLVLDNSGSMGIDVMVPDNSDSKGVDVEASDEDKSAGFDLLDLAKHAAKTVVKALNEHDRVGVVSFSTHAKVVSHLLEATEENKRRICKAIENNIEADCATNLLDGLAQGIGLWNKSKAHSHENTKAVFVLTDGYSNSSNPPNWDTALSDLISEHQKTHQAAPTIHTFGFGTEIQSGLLQLLAQVGKGNFAYISDDGMMATVFVHSMANLMATCAIDGELVVTVPDTHSLGWSGTDIRNVDNFDTEQSQASPKSLHPGNKLQYASEATVKQCLSRQIYLGNILFGQSRDYVIPCHEVDAVTSHASSQNAASTRTMGCVSVTLHFKNKGVRKEIRRESKLSELTSLDPATESYHVARSKLCTIIGRLCAPTENPSHIAYEVKNHLESAQNAMTVYDQYLKSLDTSDCNIRSLISDSTGYDRRARNRDGQITEALTIDYYKTWGSHYLRSMLFAHANQACNTFKDKGPQRYGANSPLFVSSRDRLDELFDKSGKPRGSKISMSRLNDASNVCWTSDSAIELSDLRFIPTSDLRPGDMVQTLVGPRRVEEIVASTVRNMKMKKLWHWNRPLVITPWHPIIYAQKRDGNVWDFPQAGDHFGTAEDVEYTGKIYSLLLQKDDRPDAHSVCVGARWCVTLGHGILEHATDVRAHEYFGSHKRVKKDVERLPITKGTGVRQCLSTIRSEHDRLICGISGETATGRSFGERRHTPNLPVKSVFTKAA